MAISPKELDRGMNVAEVDRLEREIDEYLRTQTATPDNAMRFKGKSDHWGSRESRELIERFTRAGWKAYVESGFLCNVPDGEVHVRLHWLPCVKCGEEPAAPNSNYCEECFMPIKRALMGNAKPHPIARFFNWSS